MHEQAKGLLSDYQPKYNSARAVYRERKKYMEEIDWNILAVPPTGSCKVTSHSHIIFHDIWCFIHDVSCFSGVKLHIVSYLLKNLLIVCVLGIHIVILWKQLKIIGRNIPFHEQQINYRSLHENLLYSFDQLLLLVFL